LSVGGGSQFHDSGLRILSSDGDQLFIAEDEDVEKQAWSVVFKSMKCLLTQVENIRLVESSIPKPLEDLIGRQQIAKRIGDLRNRNEGKTREIIAIRNKIEECGNDHDGHNRRIARIDGLEVDIAQREKEIEILSGFSHTLTPIAIVERLI